MTEDSWFLLHPGEPTGVCKPIQVQKTSVLREHKNAFVDRAILIKVLWQKKLRKHVCKDNLVGISAMTKIRDSTVNIRTVIQKIWPLFSFLVDQYIMQMNGSKNFWTQGKNLRESLQCKSGYQLVSWLTKFVGLTYTFKLTLTSFRSNLLPVRWSLLGNEPDQALMTVFLNSEISVGLHALCLDMFIRQVSTCYKYQYFAVISEECNARSLFLSCISLPNPT